MSNKRHSKRHSNRHSNLSGIVIMVVSMVLFTLVLIVLATVYLDLDDEKEIKWAVLVAGSSGFLNYRHQADICHAYQILKRGGLNDDNIIVFMYDDIAFNEANPKKGVIINNPKGIDVYKGVPKDYTGKNATTKNLLAALLGNKRAIVGGSRKVVDSDTNDRIFIYYSGHGDRDMLSMPYGDHLSAIAFIDTLQRKYKSGTYRSMVIYVEACHAGSIFEGNVPEEWNIYVTTASNPHESSWGAYCPYTATPPPPGYETCLGDWYSFYWMENSESQIGESLTLEQQYEFVKSRTQRSHVMKYGNMDLGNDLLSLYFGHRRIEPHT